MSQKLTVKNIYGSPYGVNTLAGTVHLGAGQSIKDAEFSDAEAKNLVGNPKVFEVTGYVEPKAGADVVTGDTSANLVELAAAKQTLAEIAALFGTDEVDELNVKAAVERLIQDHETLARSAGADTSRPTDIAAAVALLDDANDDHWTQTGQPKIAALETLLGKDTSAADYAALPDAQKRMRKTA